MAKIVFVTFYNDFSVGMNILNSKLMSQHHDIYNIYFKLPIKKKIKKFSTSKANYMEAVDAYGNIVSGNDMVNKWTDKEVNILTKLISELSPDIIGFSSRSTDNDLASYLFPKIRKQVNSILLAGGVGPSLNPEKYVDLVDYVIIGEAENTINKLVKKLMNNGNLSSFPGIFYKKNGNIITNRVASPDDTLFKKQINCEQSFYIENNELYEYQNRDKLINTHTYSTFYGKGCINKCSYCSIGNWYAIYTNEGYSIKPRRNRKVEDIIDELKNIDKKNITFIHFRDEFLTAKSEELIRFFSLYEKEICLPFWAYLVPQQIIEHPDILKKAVDAGFVDTEVGFQSGSDYINRTVFNRKIPHKYTVAYTHLLDKYNINRKYDFIIGNPFEEQKHIQETFRLIQSLPKDRSYLFLPKLFSFPNAPLSKLLEKYSLSSSADNEEYYKIGLLYLICFVSSKDDFQKVVKNSKLNGSSKKLFDYYNNYITKRNITFPVGTHEIPNSITTPRYERIIDNNQYDKVIIWKDDEFFNEMAHVFSKVKRNYIVDNKESKLEEEKVADILKKNATVPIFICSSKKQQIKRKILTDYPNFLGRVYV